MSSSSTNMKSSSNTYAISAAISQFLKSTSSSIAASTGSNLLSVLVNVPSVLANPVPGMNTSAFLPVSVICVSETIKKSRSGNSTVASSPKIIRPLTPSSTSGPAFIPISTIPCELFLAFTRSIPSLGEPICPEIIAISPINVAASTLTIFCW